MPTQKQQQLQLSPGEMTPRARRSIDSVNEGLRLLNPSGADAEDIEEKLSKNPRQRYAAMHAHRELAAMALSIGSTQRMAAKYAGVSPRQIKKYYADPDFRVRIEELRAVLASKMKGKIMRELNRRLTGDKLKNMDTLEMLRIFDRITTGGKGMAINVSGDLNVNNKYEAILAAILDTDASNDGADFPQFGDRGVTIPGRSTPVEG